jgi:type VI secretion system protein ImpC
MTSDSPRPDRSRKQPELRRVRVELPLVIGVLADLAGNSPTIPLKPLRERTFMEVDRDTYPGLLSSIAPGLSLVVRDCIAGMDQDQDASKTIPVVLRFQSLEDFQPGGVTRQIEQLTPLLRERQTIARTRGSREPREVASDSDQAARRLADLDRAISSQWAEIILHPAFQRLEAAWRGLHYLVSRAETSSSLRIRVLSVAKDELRADLDRALEFDQSDLFHKVYHAIYSRPLAEPFTFLVGDYEFGPDVADVRLLSAIAQVAAVSHSPFVAAASPTMFRRTTYAGLADVQNLCQVFEGPEFAAWNAFRDSEDACDVALLMPPLLVRQSYGQRQGDETQSPPGPVFDPSVAGVTRDTSLWMNAAWAYAAGVADSFARYSRLDMTRGIEGGGMVEELPARLVRTDQVEVQETSPVQAAITDRQEFELSQLGFMPVVFSRATQSAFFISNPSCNRPRTYVRPEAQATAQLAARMNQRLDLSRFVQYLIAITRDRSADWLEPREAETVLNAWINDYISPSAATPLDVLRRPLADARIEVREASGQPGAWEMRVALRPHMQLENLSASLSLVVSLPKSAGDQTDAYGASRDLTAKPPTKRWPDTGEGSSEQTSARKVEPRADRSALAPGVQQPPGLAPPDRKNRGGASAPSGSSLQHKLDRIRPPRCRLTYEVDLEPEPPGSPESTGALVTPQQTKGEGRRAASDLEAGLARTEGDPSNAFGEAIVAYLGAWVDGRKPHVEDFLGLVPEARRSYLLTTLLKIELDRRQLGGESPSVEEYQSQFPGDPEAVRKAFEHILAARDDEARAAFEDAWRAGRNPDLEEFLRRAPEARRSSLLTTLLKIELDHRQRRGESPKVQEYQNRFPGDPKAVRDAFEHFLAVRDLVDIPLGCPDLGGVWAGGDLLSEREVALKVLTEQSGAPSRLRRLLGRLRGYLTRKPGRAERMTVPVSPTIVRRHTDVSFPALVLSGKRYNLRVVLVPAEETLAEGGVRERPRPHAHDATMNLLVPSPPRRGDPPPPIRVNVSVAAENFEIDGPSRAELVVPLEGRSSTVQFGLRGLDAGPGRVMIDFAQDGRPVGSVDLAPEVVADLDSESERIPGGPARAMGGINLNLGLGLNLAPPDLVLKVFEHRLTGHPGRLQFVLSSSLRSLVDLPVLDGDLGTLDLKADVSDWVGTQLQAVSALAEQSDATAEVVTRTLGDVGCNLFQQLLPPALQDLCWTFRQRGVKTMMILSDEPHIPWELIKPFRADSATGEILAEDEFWGQSFALTHWLRGRPPVPRLSVQRVVTLAAGSTRLDLGPESNRLPSAAAAESSLGPTRNMVVKAPPFASMLQPFAPDCDSPRASTSPVGLSPLALADEELVLLRVLESLGARIVRLPAQRNALRELFEQGDFDVLHLASHGGFGGTTAADASGVLLDDGIFTAAELSPRMAGPVRLCSPLVFFNACHSGRLGFSLTRLGAWGAHFVHMGCGGFVGALWPVTDQAALAFARAFYELLSERYPIGEAVRVSRQRVHELFPNDSSWLAYRCFADPMARVEPLPFGDEPTNRSA